MKLYDEDDPARDHEKPDKVLRVRLRMAQAFIDMLLYAYDALVTHGIDFRKLKAYEEDRLLDEAAALPLEAGHDSFITWIGRVKNAIKAAIRRKDFHKV